MRIFILIVFVHFASLSGSKEASLSCDDLSDPENDNLSASYEFSDKLCWLDESLLSAFPFFATSEV